MKTITLEHIIRKHIILGRPNAQGWCPVLCKVCHDRGHKGPRAAFRFTGEVTGYNCFNCGHTTMYDPNVHRSMPKKMLEVLAAFGIPDTDWNTIIFQNLSKVRNTDSAQHTFVSIEPSTVEFPPQFYKLTDDPDDDVAQYAIEYLTNERRIDWKAHPFYLCDSTIPKWFGRLIIPVYKNNNLIYWQGRDLTGLHKQKYLSPSIVRDNVLYGYENLYTDIDEPLYVMEGWFDAFLLSGIAVFGSKLSDAQITWLNNSPRKKVVIPDRFGDGYRLANKAIELGWAVSTPDAPGCKDVSDVVNKYGMLYALKTIHNNTFSGFEAKLRVQLFCNTGTQL